MERFTLKRIRNADEKEKIFILFGDKKCGFIDRDKNNLCQINFSVKYENRSGFRFVKVAKPAFASENDCLEYLNNNSSEIFTCFSLHFFTKI